MAAPGICAKLKDVVTPDIAPDMLLAVEHVMVIIRPCAGGVGLGGADQAEPGRQTDQR